MKTKKNNKILYLLLLLVLGISIGYAALASNLKINGAAGVKNASWIIYLTNPQVVDGSVTDTKPELSQNNTVATYSVTLNKPGDFYEFTIDTKNDGTLDAEILNVISKFDNEDGDNITEQNLPPYLEYFVTYANGDPISSGDGLLHGETKTFRVRVAYSEDITASDLQDEDITKTFYFEVQYKQKEKASGSNEGGSSSSTNTMKVTSGDKNNLKLGDTVTVNEEQEFNVISSDSEKTVLLAKYNLYVGNIISSGGYSLIPEDDEHYMLQYSKALGSPGDNSGTTYGTVHFSSKDYWSSSFESSDPSPLNVYRPDLNAKPLFDQNDPVYGTISNDDYSVAYFVEEYVKKLKIMGAPSEITGRLLTYKEVVDNFNCSLNVSCPLADDKKFLGNTAFYLGDAATSSTVYAVWGGVSHNSDPTLGDDGYRDYSFMLGVRPVIEVPTEYLR